jgi:hypothetical protein
MSNLTSRTVIGWTLFLLCMVVAAMLASCAYNNCNVIKTSGPVTFSDGSVKGASSMSQNISPTTNLPSTAPSGSLDMSTGTKQAPQASATTPADPNVYKVKPEVPTNP